MKDSSPDGSQPPNSPHSSLSDHAPVKDETAKELHSRRAEDSPLPMRQRFELRLQERTEELDRVNAALQKEIAERHKVEEALRQTQDELERRVEERTAELADVLTALREEVAERQQTETQLSQQQKILQTIFDHIPVMISFFDSDGKFQLANREWERVSGWSSEEMKNFPDPLSVLTPNAHEHQRAAKHKRDIEDTWEEFEMQTRDGRILNTLWCNVLLPDGTRIGIGQDITQSKQNAEKQERLAAILEATSDFVGIADVAGHVIYVNKAGRQMIGIGEDEDITQTVTSEYYATPTDIALTEGVPCVMRDGLWRGETTFLSRDGREIPVSQVILAHNPEGKEVEFISTIARDITERKQAVVSLQQAKEEAETANRAKSEFLSRMSHELRTPLNAILGFGQLFDKEKLDADDRENVEQIMRAGRHLLDLINEVLDIARIEAGRLTLSLEAISVQEVTQEVLSLMQPLAAERDVRLENLLVSSNDAASDGREDLHVLADRQRFKQVLLNIVSNAVKYNRPGGAVRVSVKIEETSARLLVNDTGLGISSSNQQKLFTPFERLDADSRGVEGTGVGLALSKRLTEVMGGSIGVDSVVGHGSTFWIELPRAESPLRPLERAGQESLRSPIEPAMMPEHEYTILYIEDNLPNLKLIERILMHRPRFRLMAAMQGSLGLDLAREHRPDFILLDLHLPGMGGHEVLRRLQADPQTRNIPVVVISADATAGQVERLLAMGARDYLTKPFDVTQLLHLLDEVMTAKNKVTDINLPKKD